MSPRYMRTLTDNSEHPRFRSSKHARVRTEEVPATFWLDNSLAAKGIVGSPA